MCGIHSKGLHAMQSSFLLSGLSAPCHLVSLTAVLFYSEFLEIHPCSAPVYCMHTPIL